jgi:broad specificity phosphatase PhoE
MVMTDLLLVRHAEPHVIPERPASTWRLNDVGRDGARALAIALAGECPDIVVTSLEPKARETGAIIAEALDLPLRGHAGLSEQGGDTVPWIEDWDELRTLVRRHFEEPSRPVLGDEPASEAAVRFVAAVTDLLPFGRRPVLVSHGRIMASYLASVTGADAWTLWDGFRLPDAIAVDPDAGTMRHLVPR